MGSHIYVLVLLLLATIAFTEAGTAASNTQHCKIPIGSKSNYLAKWPLVFKLNGEFYPTTIEQESGEREIIVEPGTEVLLSCGPNYLKLYNRKETMNARCDGTTGNFTVNGIDMQAKELTCDLRVIEDVLDTVYGCGDQNTAARFGYVDPTEKQSFLIGEVCYDTTAGVTHFVHMKLGDAATSVLEKMPKNYLTTRRHSDGRYKIELFRGLMFDEIYERIRTTLNIKQAPFLKISKFIDESLLSNAQFQAVKKLGWNYFVGYDEHEILETLKADIKRLSSNKNLDLYVGSHGIKQFHGANGQQMEVYLHQTPKRFAMPALLWFVVKHEDKATAFAVWNDAEDINRVDIVADPKPESLCKRSDCSRVTWLSSGLQVGGKLICCEVDDFRQTVREVPVVGGVKDMLL